MLHFLRSPHPHARIVAIDTTAAAAMPGVVAIVTGADLVRAGVKPLPQSADFKRADGSPTASPPQHALAVDTVRFVGEAVAAVVAETRVAGARRRGGDRRRLRAAAGVVDLGDAVAPGAPLVWPTATGNIACEVRHGDAAASAAAFATAAHVVALDLVNQRVAPCPIEPRATLASYDAATDRITLRVSCQTPTGVRDELCDAVLGIPKDKVRVRRRRRRRRLRHEDDALSRGRRRRVLRPRARAAGEVDCAERMEEFLAATHGRDVASRAELALDADGRILALRVASLANLGAYATPAGVVIQLLIGPWVSTSIYDIRHDRHPHQGVLTNTAPTGPYRGAGRPEAIYIIERLMDAAARQTGIDPRRAAPPQHDPARADAVQERDGQDLRHRQVRVA